MRSVFWIKTVAGQSLWPNVSTNLHSECTYSSWRNPIQIGLLLPKGRTDTMRMGFKVHYMNEEVVDALKVQIPNDASHWFFRQRKNRRRHQNFYAILLKLYLSQNGRRVKLDTLIYKLQNSQPSQPSFVTLYNQRLNLIHGEFREFVSCGVVQDVWGKHE